MLVQEKYDEVSYSVDLDGVEQVERHGSNQVKYEPTTNVIERYQLMLKYHLPAFIHVRCKEVQQYVYNNIFV